MSLDLQFWLGVLGVISALIGVQFSMNRSARADQRERHTEHERRDKHLDERMDRLDKELHECKDALLQEVKENEGHIADLRSDLQNHYVRNEALTEFRREVREDFGKVFDRLSTISRGMERLIGSLKKPVFSED